ncbi:hypothetical protein [Rhodopirellula sp. MGV]|uniref:hypothetical protein n=1 Tax=Rhodopirellula sp. MGV TaxID=2023130 RepID=UPI000B9687FE|nr:hypothetical protein [Rhodopirellula sp. MGV]OYP28466.1 hypothetical protein CGZ80_27080 [Rhodopirellula sp. MGV]PNY38656.1 hypothetical protein C2E31_01690 [Rhodopirellula baltica]
MNIEISDQSTRSIEKALGTTDPVVISRLFERIVSDEQLLQSYLVEDPTDDELRQSLAMCDRGSQEMEEGKAQPADEALRKIAQKHGLNVDR